MIASLNIPTSFLVLIHQQHLDCEFYRLDYVPKVPEWVVWVLAFLPACKQGSPVQGSGKISDVVCVAL